MTRRLIFIARLLALALVWPLIAMAIALAWPWFATERVRAWLFRASLGDYDA